MTERKHPNAICENCSRYAGKYVADKNGRTNDIIFVGEAPGQSDIINNEPLTGASGKLLNLILSVHDIDRRDVYITNLVSCSSPVGEPPTKGEIDCCSPRLHATIQQINPEYVLPLGSTVAKEVLRTKTGIKELRLGGPKEYPFNFDIKVIPTVSPAFVLRAADNFPSLARDIGKINEQVYSNWIAPHWFVLDDNTQITLNHINSIPEASDYIVVDIEVGVEKDEFGTHPERYEFLCIGLGYAQNEIVIIGEQALKYPEVWQALSNVFKRCNVVCHNGKFDIAALRKYCLNMMLDADTMLASYCLDERTGVHSLGYLAREILGAPNWKDALKPYIKNGNYSSVPRPLLYQYNAYDIACTQQLHHLFTKQLKARGLTDLHNMLIDSSNALMALEMDGMIVDIDYLNKLDLELQEEGELFELILLTKFGLENPRSWQQVQKYLKTQGVHVKSTDETTLTELFAQRSHLNGLMATIKLEQPALSTAYKDSVCEFIHTLLEYRGLAKLWGTYVNGIRTRLYKNKIYPNLSMHTTVTGRLSSKDPNLQNIPRGKRIKRLFIPASGNVYVQCDYRAAELRVVGSLAHCKYLRDVLNDPARDIHGEVAKQYYGANFTSEQRTNCKRIVFGSTYGAEAPRVAGILGVSILEGAQFLKNFFALMPEVVDWREDVKQEVLAGHDLVTFTNRHRRHRLISNLNKKDLVKEGYAFLPQSTASDLTLLAANNLRLRSGLETRMLVHDSILVECKQDDANTVLEQMQHEMETVAKQFTDYIDFTTEGAIGDSWATV